MKRSSCVAVAALWVCANLAQAHEFEQSGLLIDHRMAFETAPNAMSAGGYMSITKMGESDDRLIAVKADFPKVMLHGTEETDGIARMSHIEAVELPAGETVALSPAGLHVMFIGLDGDPFEVGEEIPATPVFETAGEVAVVFHVEARSGSADAAHDRSAHGAHH